MDDATISDLLCFLAFIGLSCYCMGCFSAGEFLGWYIKKISNKSGRKNDDGNAEG